MNEFAANHIDPLPSEPSPGSTVDVRSSTQQERCRHCGLLSEGEFCCSGCRAVYTTLTDLGLTDYYKWRDPNNLAPIPLCDTDSVCAEFSTINLGQEPTAEFTFELTGIHCAGCLWLLEKLPDIQPGVIRSSLNASTGELVVWFRPAELSLQTMVRMLIKLGYPPRSPSGREIGKSAGSGDLLRIGVAGFAAMNTMMLAVSLFEGLFTGIDPEMAGIFRWVSFFLTVPVVFWAGLPLYEHALRALRSRRVHIELPLTIAIFAAFILSAANTIAGRPFVYFDSVCVLVFLLLISRKIQEEALGRARRGARIGWSLLPAKVTILSGADRHVSRIEDLVVGDLVLIGAGERIPADGTLVEGMSSLDCSILTGEATPTPVSPGAAIPAGSMNLTSEIVIRVSSIGDSTRVGKLLKELRGNSSEKGFLDRFTDLVGRGYLAALGAAALITFLVHRSDFSEAVEALFTLLIVTCPCALAFSVPTLYGLTIGAAAKRGILIKSKRVLEDMVGIRHVFLDKTGTLTEGRFTVNKEAWFFGDLQEAITVLAALTSLQPLHPVSRALRSAYGITALDPLLSRHYAGRGVELERDGHLWRLGSPGWAGGELLEPRIVNTVVNFSRDGELVARFEFGDKIKPSASSTLKSLVRSGRKVTILSGDRNETVRVFADAGISYHGSLTPQQKAHYISRSDERSMFVGDGVNDVLALQAADIGIALAGGLEATVEAADVVLTSGSLDRLLELLEAAARTRRVVLFSLGISVLYNLSAAALAIAGWMNPLIAAFLMPTSSLSVIGLSLLYRPFGRHGAL